MMSATLRQWATAALVTTLAIAQAASAEGPTVVYKARGSYDDVRDNLQIAIEGRGLLVRGVSHVADMLNRTGPDLGFAKSVYLKAEALEFCSADLSHRMVLVDPSNLTTCPLTVAVYVLTDEPDQVYVGFRRQIIAGPGHEEIEAKLFALVDGIAREAIE
jgi:uncharacterized protein (DUF302 family)